MSQENTLSFHGVCHYIGRLSQAAKFGMRSALAGCPKCHFPMLESIIGCIHSHGQDDAVYVSDLAREFHQPMPAISRGLRMMEQDGLIAREADPADRRKTLVRVTPKGLAASRECETALNDYFTCILARLTPEQVQQMNALRGALMDAILAENEARKSELKGEPNHDEDL